jgi:hypothetical protein
MDLPASLGRTPVRPTFVANGSLPALRDHGCLVGSADFA